MERILVGTDLSARGNAAVRIAANLAHATDATLHLLHASPAPNTATSVSATTGLAIPYDHQATIRTATTELEAISADLRRQGLHVEVHICLSRASEALCATAETIHADLIVVGNRRMQGATRFLGSVGGRVAHHAPCSVLVAKTAE